MTRESYIYGLLATDLPLKDAGLQSLYRAGAVQESPEEECFAILVWGASSPELPEDIHTRQLVVWVYDTPGYYGRIDAILARLREIMRGVIGAEVRQVGWIGDSDDLFDDKYERALRTGSYTVH